MTQQQANRASDLCAQALEIIARLQRDFDQMKAASAEFEKRMAEQHAVDG